MRKPAPPMPLFPDDTHERAHGAHLGRLIAGIDEAGRGPWAGPVVAAAVILDLGNIPVGMNDSKKMKPAAREALYDQIVARARCGIGQASVEEIDRLNILQATMLAMQRALDALHLAHDCCTEVALIDGNRAPALPCRSETLVGGDARCLSIAAASILAKTWRDRQMVALHAEFPYYGWAGNAGYGTAAHQSGIASHGVTPHHRRSFTPIRQWLERAA